MTFFAIATRLPLLHLAAVPLVLHTPFLLLFLFAAAARLLHASLPLPMQLPKQLPLLMLLPASWLPFRWVFFSSSSHFSSITVNASPVVSAVLPNVLHRMLFRCVSFFMSSLFEVFFISHGNRKCAALPCVCCPNRLVDWVVLLCLCAVLHVSLVFF